MRAGAQLKASEGAAAHLRMSDVSSAGSCWIRSLLDLVPAGSGFMLQRWLMGSGGVCSAVVDHDGAASVPVVGMDTSNRRSCRRSQRSLPV